MGKSKKKNTQKQVLVHPMEDRTTIQGVQYKPNGADHQIQQVITDLLHRVVQVDGRVTLGELGYMHMNTITYSPQKGIDVRVYFDARLAARLIKSKVNKKEMAVPIVELNIFNGYLFVGSYADVVSFEAIMAPKSKIVIDELGRQSLKIKDTTEYKETAVVVMHCNLPITMAAAHGINLWDPNFSVRCTTVGKGSKKQEKAIITSGNGEVPLSVMVTKSDSNEYDGYDPDDAVPYLMTQAEKAESKEKNQKKLTQKIEKKAKSKKAKKSVKKSQKSTTTSFNNKAFNKYS